MDCLLVADDLTGACDAAVHFAMRGLHPVAVLVAPEAQHSTARVLAVTTESRDLPPAEIRPALSLVAAKFPIDSAALVFKKIDSTLRGNMGLEIAAALESFHCDAAVVCPAFPKMRRIVERGVLRVAGSPDFEPLDVAPLLQLQSGHPCAPSRPDRIADLLHSGARVVSVDAACDEDLDRIAAALLPLGRRILWAGSAGLASALARLVGERCDPPAVPPHAGPALFCIGSDHAVTLAQQEALLAGRPAVLVHPHDTARQSICAALARGEHVILRVPRGQVAAGPRCGNGSTACRSPPSSSPAATRHPWSAARPACKAFGSVMKSFRECRAASCKAEPSTGSRSPPSPAASAIAIP